jgi:hypothetical protein
MKNLTPRTFDRTASGKLIVLEDVQAAFLSRYGSILLDSECTTIDFLSVNDGNEVEHFKDNVKKLKPIGNAKQRLTLPDGGFIMPNIIKTVVNSEAHSSVLIIGINEKVLFGFDNDEYPDLDGLFNSITDALVAISSNKNGRVDWSAYSKIDPTQKTNSPVPAKKESQTPPPAPAK